MRATISRYLQTLKQRRSGDEGFSLIELIVVVAVLGVLVAIAVPVFLNIQQQAKDNALATVVANGATQAASAYAQFPDAAAATAAGAKYPTDATFFDNLTADTNPKAALTITATAKKELDTFCVTGTGMGADAAKTFNSGPGCS